MNCDILKKLGHTLEKTFINITFQASLPAFGHKVSYKTVMGTQKLIM